MEYWEVFGVYILGFKKMDAHMAEMMNEVCTVQSTQTRDAGKGFFRARSAPGGRRLAASAGRNQASPVAARARAPTLPRRG